MKYIIFKETVFNEEMGEYMSYGISVREKGNEVRRFSDVCRSRKRVCRLCRLCNRLKVSAEQFDYIIEDFCVGESY
ncbi:MAG: hypothetical protein IKU65_02040 [Oscillospiraceae bacterium]|nr:hypothetical protein [Oscillospiraceae bacterium]